MSVLVESFLSVEGVLAHLDDSDSGVVECALSTLVELIPHHWAEISEQISKIESLSESESFPHTQLASLLASKVFFHIGSYEDALTHALSAGQLFKIEEPTEYVQKLTEQCIDSYRAYRQREYAVERGTATEEEKAAQPDNIDTRLVEIVERMLNYCYQNGDFKHALGIALECRRLDHIEKALTLPTDEAAVDVLHHCFALCETVLTSRIFRDEVLTMLVQSYMNLPPPLHYNHICRCYFYLNQPKDIADILWRLVQDQSTELVAFQVGFDLAEYQNERFLRAVFASFPQPPATEPVETSTDTGEPTVADKSDAAPPAGGEESAAPESQPEAEAAAEADEQGDVAMGGEAVDDSVDWTPELTERYDRLRHILLGEIVIPLQLDFLFRNNRSDLLLLKQMKDHISERSSVLNNALLCSNAMMHSGTTIDQFLRDNLDWMARAAHWAKFVSVASLGQIHHHHLDSSRQILQRYLPGSGGGPYQEGGSLYALGLIHVGDNNPKTNPKDYLMERMAQASNEILQHGACLGLGLVSMGSQDDTVLQAVRNLLYQDGAVPGESAGYALGLICCGGNPELNEKWFDEMLSYAHETQHEKIIRGLAMGIAVMHYAMEERANGVIDTLLSDDDETIRYGGCYTIGMAYVATANNSAISRLLHLAVSDVSDDVRRAAVTNIGFVLCNKPETVPKVVQLLANSYNAHVRYGAAAAIGIACAATGNLHALQLLKKLATDDPIDYVRQAAMISLGMLLQQHNKKETPQIQSIRDDILLKVVQSKHGSVMAKMGAIYGLGIMDACGRNAIISLCSDNGRQKRMTAIVGMAVFWQHWFWYPLVPCITLCFQPTMIMALNKDLAMPKMQFQSNAPPSLYAYPDPLKEESKAKAKALTKAVLSITAKEKARQIKRQKTRTESESGEAFDASVATIMEEAETGADQDTEMKEKSAPSGVTAPDAADAAAVSPDAAAAASPDAAAAASPGAEAEEESDEKEKKEQEPLFEMLDNPSRVTFNQRKYMVWKDDRYRPVNNEFLSGSGGAPRRALSGIIMVDDSAPDKEVELVETKTLDTGGIHGNEPKPPKPFKYMGN